MNNVVIEIDGTRHKLYNKDVVSCGCQACSLEEKCTGANGICFPFLAAKQYGHFIMEDKI